MGIVELWVVGFHWGDLVFLFCNSIFWEGGRDFEG